VGVIYIIIKKRHTCCKNKICIEENPQKRQQTTLYNEKTNQSNNQSENQSNNQSENQSNKQSENQSNKQNIKLTINTQTKKLRALDKFKKTKNPIPKRRSRFKSAIQNINSINNLKNQSNNHPKYPPGMDANQLQKTISHLPTTPPHIKVPIQPPKLTGDIV
tara:strand:+ start:1254 stop:1739 length:486 start_codon:yes stop_codon:yes gene_type:complete